MGRRCSLRLRLFLRRGISSRTVSGRRLASTMSSIEDKFQKAADEGTIPGVVLMATDAKGMYAHPSSPSPGRDLIFKPGKFQYQKAFGPKGPTEAMDLSATFFLASCTKLMTSIAALQCVERRQIGLDDDVAPILTELKELQILTGFEEGTETPILIPVYEKITLR
jgi:CubicO group peptidase (beta-lactamase class C family)